MSITMKKIAELAGVNISTVSRVLNNESSISTDIRNKVIDIANKYNYKKRKTRNKNIVYIIDKRFFLLTSHFYNRIIEGIEEEVKKRGYTFQFNSLEPNQFFLGNLNINNIAGIIITSHYHNDFVIEAKKLGIPLVLVDHYLPTEDIYAVLPDKIDGVIKGINYLASLGHKNIAYLKGDVSQIGGWDRLIGFKRAVEMFSLNKDENLIIDCDLNIKGAYLAFKKFLENCKHYPTAVMCANDTVAIGAMEAVKEKNLNIPDDISILGFDDIDLAREVIPNLSTMHVRKQTMGRLAVQTLFRIINGEEIPYNKTMIKPTLIIRESTGKPGKST